MTVSLPSRPERKRRTIRAYPSCPLLGRLVLYLQAVDRFHHDGSWRTREPPEPALFKLPGEGGRLAIEQVIDGLVLTKTISEHDALVAYKLAYVLTGGNTASPAQEVGEQFLLDLEREAFVALCKLPKTQERMQHLLMKGKPLRN